MKKITSLLLVILFAFINFGNTVLAQAENSAPVTFFESTENMTRLNSYRMVQNLSGDFNMKVDEMEPKTIDGDYSLSINSDVINRESLESDYRFQIGGNINVRLNGKDKPFNDLNVNFRADITMIGKEGIYIRLQNLGFQVSGLKTEEMANFQEIQKQITDELAKVKWKWIYLPAQEYQDKIDQGIPAELNGVFDEKAFKLDLKEKGLKEAYKKLILDLLRQQKENGTMTEEEFNKMNKIATDFFNAQFFRIKENKNGLTTFILNKNRILDFARKAIKEMGEASDKSVLAELKNILEKFYLAGAYHSDADHRIFDLFKLKLILRNIEELVHFQFNYVSKISRINEVKTIQKPAYFTPVDELDLGFLRAPAMEDSTGSTLEIAPTDLGVPVE